MARNLRRLLVRVVRGTPLARLVPVRWRPRRILGQDQGLFEVPEDFDAPLPEEVPADFPPAGGPPP